MLILLLYIVSADFVVTKFPRDEAVSLQTDAPLFLSFMVCGRTADFTQQRPNLKIDLSHRVRLTPRLKASLVRNRQAEIFGLSLSLSNTTSPNFEMCNEDSYWSGYDCWSSCSYWSSRRYWCSHWRKQKVATASEHIWNRRCLCDEQELYRCILYGGMVCPDSHQHYLLL